MLSWFILIGIIAGFMIGTYYLYHYWNNPLNQAERFIEEGVLRRPKKTPRISKKAYEYAYQKFTSFRGGRDDPGPKIKRVHEVYAFHHVQTPESNKGDHDITDDGKEGYGKVENSDESLEPHSYQEKKEEVISAQKSDEMKLEKEKDEAPEEFQNTSKVQQVHQLDNERKGGYVMPELQQVEGLELIKTPVVVGENVIQRMEVTDLTLDMTAVKVRDILATIVNLDTDVIEDKVIIQGTIHKQIFYVGTDNIIHHQAEDVSFSYFVEIPGAEPGMDVFIEPTVEHVVSQLILDGRVLHQKVVVQFFVKVLTVQQLIVETGAADRFPLFKVQRVIGENTVQTMVINDVALAVPATKIDTVDAEVQNLVVDLIDDKVIIQGIIHKQLFYIGTDELEHHQAEDIPFSEFIDIPGAEPGMNVQIHPTIEHVKQVLSPDGTTVTQEIVLELFGKVTQSIQTNLVPGDDSLVLLPEVIGENMKQILSETTLLLEQPAIKIQDIEASFTGINTVVINNKVIVQGIIHKQIFYVGQDDNVYHQMENVPFSTFVEVMGARPGMNVDITPTVTFVKPILTPAGDSLIQKVIGDIFVKVTNNVQFNVSEVGPYGV